MILLMAGCPMRESLTLLSVLDAMRSGPMWVYL